MTADPLVILLAEDDPGHATLVQRILKRSGIANAVVHVADGQLALDYVRRAGNYASRDSNDELLLLLDVNMPRLDGVEVLRQIKQDETTAKLPVIMLTTTDDPREIERCYKLGCSVYISKPVDYQAFVEAVKRLGLLLQVVKVPQENAVLAEATP